MSGSTPTLGEVAGKAVEIHRSILGDPEFDAFKAASLTYSDDWTCFDGTVVVDKWDLAVDAEPLFGEAVRAIALKCAIYALTGDEKAAEIPIAVPVDEMMHACLAQTQILDRIEERQSIQVIHQTDQEDTAWEPGSFTDACYRGAWGEPNGRFWLSHEVVAARKEELDALYRSIGIHGFGHRSTVEFTAA